MLLPSNTVVTDAMMIFNVHSFGHYELASGGMSHCDFYMTHTLITNVQMYSQNTNVGGWHNSVMRGFLNVDLYPVIPSHWKQLIAQSVTLASAGNKSSEILSSTDYFRIPSNAELGWNFDASPYKDEIDSRANEVVFSQYTTNASRVKKNYYGTGSAVNWWTRSAIATSTSQFVLVGTGGAVNGSNGNNNAGNGWGVCAGFSC